ncbi:hypothetical protein SK128_005738, partial [Halocaridina rubra]
IETEQSTTMDLTNRNHQTELISKNNDTLSTRSISSVMLWDGTQGHRHLSSSSALSHVHGRGNEKRTSCMTPTAITEHKC